MSKDNGANAIKAHDDISIGNPNNQQQFNLGWIDSSTYQNLCYILRIVYRHVLSAMRSQGTMRQHYKALRTKPF